MISRELRQRLEHRLLVPILGARPIGGGDINDAYAIEFQGGITRFVKVNESAPAGLFTAEAEGLDWLRASNSLRVPEVILVSEPEERPGYLVLEWLSSARPARDFDERLGSGLAALHRAGAPTFGFVRDNFIGSLPQANGARPTWGEFFRDQRLEPQLRRAVEQNRLSYAARRAFERLFARLEEVVGPDEPPSRLHGDLWSGNLHVDERGLPCWIDPAVYGGHREVDLAMMRLFGGFSERVFSVYAEAFPLAPGAEARVALYQLYPLLVHVNLFGGGYGASVERALSRYV